MTRIDPVSFDLGLVPERGKELVLVPSESERAAIAEWLRVESLGKLEATIQISRHAENEYSYAAHFEADIVQACVVTLAPVSAHISGDASRDFRVRPRQTGSRRRKAAAEPQAIDISILEDDGPELLDSPIVDVAAPLLEELSLALDPYPRAPGVVFEPPPEEEEPVNHPFAVLERLKMAKAGPSEPSESQIKPSRAPGAKKGR
jgi:hypothetical protein